MQRCKNQTATMSIGRRLIIIEKNKEKKKSMGVRTTFAYIVNVNKLSYSLL